MSFQTRLKERREFLNMSRIILADKIGVTPAAIANYENGVSSPRADLLYKLFDALNCDANYLYQDDIKNTYETRLTISEEKLIKNYRNLDSHGKELIDIVIKKELERLLEEN